MRGIVTALAVPAALWIAAGAAIAYVGSNRHGDPDRLLGQGEADSALSRKIREMRRAVPERISEEYEIRNREGLRLHGYLIRAKRPSRVFVFFSHGYRSPDGAMEFGGVLPMWEGHDYNFFLVDHRAQGKSEGSHISFGQHEAEDNMEWLGFLLRTFGEDIRILLHGESMGAATVLMMSGMALPPQVKGIIADSSYTSYFEESLHALRFPFRRAVLKSANLWLRLFHGIDMKKAAPLEAVKRAEKPILFTHGGRDPLVPPEMGRALYAACRAEKRMVVFPDAAHTTAVVEHPREYAAAVDDFLRSCLDGQEG